MAELLETRTFCCKWRLSGAPGCLETGVGPPGVGGGCSHDCANAAVRVGRGFGPETSAGSFPTWPVGSQRPWSPRGSSFHA